MLNNNRKKELFTGGVSGDLGAWPDTPVGASAIPHRWPDPAMNKIFDAVPDAVIVSDTAGTILLKNSAPVFPVNIVGLARENPLGWIKKMICPRQQLSST